MSFIRAKEIPPGSGNWYDYEVENHREGDKVVQKHIRYIGRAGGGGAGRSLGTTSSSVPSPVQRMTTALSIVPRVEPESRPSLGTTPIQSQPDAIAVKAKQIYDTTRPTPQVLKFYGEKSLTPIQRATLPEIEAHLRLVDRISKEYGKTLNPEKYKLGISEDELRADAKIYWTKGKRIEASKNLSAKQSRQRDLIQEAMKVQPNSRFLESLMEQTYQKHHQLSAKQLEAVEKIIHGERQSLGPTQTSVSPPESRGVEKPITPTIATQSSISHPQAAPEPLVTKPHIASLGTTPKERELKYVSLPSLDKGEIWATKNEGVFVVVSHRPAQWRGEDADVYGHINEWNTIRPASPEETKLWDEAVKSANAEREMRAKLGVPKQLFGYTYNPSTRELQPSPESTRRLDSYDDRWEPPKSIQLTDEQVDIVERNVKARAALKTKA